MKIKNFYLMLLAILFIASSCNDNPDFEPTALIEDQPLNTAITLEEFEGQIIQEFSGNTERGDLKGEIPDELGNVFLDGMISFESLENTPVAFIPIFGDQSKHTEAIIIAANKTDKIRYGLYKRGKLADVFDDPQAEQSQLRAENVADVFMAFDKQVFNLNERNYSEIIGRSNNTNIQSGRFSIETGDFDDVASEWVSELNCLVVFGETDYDNCWWSVSWVEGAGDSVEIDGGGSSGGGSSGGGEEFGDLGYDKTKKTNGNKPLVDCSYFTAFGYTCSEMGNFQVIFQSAMSDSEFKIYVENLDKAQRSKYVLNARIAIDKANQYFTGWKRNGIGDAYRQGLQSALNTISLGSSLTASLQQAHSTRPDSHPYFSKEIIMEGRNNLEGRNIVIPSSSTTTLHYVSNQVYYAVLYGTKNFAYLSNLDAVTRRPNFYSQLIPTNQ